MLSEKVQKKQKKSFPGGKWISTWYFKNQIFSNFEDFEIIRFKIWQILCFLKNLNCLKSFNSKSDALQCLSQNQNFWKRTKKCKICRSCEQNDSKWVFFKTRRIVKNVFQNVTRCKNSVSNPDLLQKIYFKT